MTYFTNWDINVFLCFLYCGLPWDLVREIVKVMTRTHKRYIEEEARKWYCDNSPSLFYKAGENGGWSFKTLTRTRNPFISEFKLTWIWRCPEVRRDLISRMVLFENVRDIERLKWDYDPLNGRYRIDSEKDLPQKGRYHSSEGLWDVWGGYQMRSCELNENHKLCISNWYGDIHEGRYFLFFKENNLVGFGKRNSKNIKISEKVKRFGTIHSIGPYQQMAEDLLVIDGPGLGKSGEKIEHIDDYFR